MIGTMAVDVTPGPAKPSTICLNSTGVAALNAAVARMSKIAPNKRNRKGASSSNQISDNSPRRMRTSFDRLVGALFIGSVHHDGAHGRSKYKRIDPKRAA